MARRFQVSHRVRSRSGLHHRRPAGARGRMMRSATLLSLLVAVNLACPDADDDGVPFDAGPTDTGEAADGCSGEVPCPLTPDVRGSDQIAPIGDLDAWTFDVATAGKVLNVLVENDATISPIDLEVVLFDPDMQS